MSLNKKGMAKAAEKPYLTGYCLRQPILLILIAIIDVSMTG